MTAPAPEPALIGLKDVAYLTGLSVQTLRSDWKDRVRAKKLPATHPAFKHPRWARQAILDFLENAPVSVAADTSSPKIGTRGHSPHAASTPGAACQGAARTGSKLCALMTQNQGD